MAGQLNAGVKGLMKKNKVTVVEGDGAITGKGKLSVKQGGKTTELAAKHIIVATGARARDLPFAKADGDGSGPIATPWCRSEMPTKLLVIGSGAIGVEFASFYSDMGAEVTIVEMLPRILPVEDEEVSAFVHKALDQAGDENPCRLGRRQARYLQDRRQGHDQGRGRGGFLATPSSRSASSPIARISASRRSA